MLKKYSIRYYNFKLLIFTLALAVIGIIAVGSADASLLEKQMGAVILGAIVMIVLSLFNYGWLMRFHWILYGISMILLIMVLIIGERGNGAQRWLVVFGIQFQPSELAKLVLIISLAAFVNRHHEDINSIWYILLCAAIFGAKAALIYKQPDLSTTIILCLIFVTVMFVADIRWKTILGVVVIAIPIGLILMYLIMQPNQKIISEYQKGRILSFFNKEQTANDAGYQQTYSVMAIGSGQLSGKGYKNNEIYSVKNADFIAEQQTDFIFAVIGEEFGFIGTCTVIVLIFLISFECFMIGFRAKDIGGRMISAGVGAWIGFQGFINIGVVTYLLPNTGLPLPLVSYGRTATFCTFAAIGIVLNVGLQCDEK